jgi:hypothetical protein
LVFPARVWPKAVPPGLDKIEPEWNDFENEELRDEAVDAALALQFHVRDSASATVPAQHLDSLRVGQIVVHSTPASFQGLKNDHQGRKTDDKP